MSFIQFESGSEKEKIRQELRNVREELLKRAQKHAETRAERNIAKKLRGDDNWMLPDVLNKITNDSEKCSTGKSKKSTKKSKKGEKTKKSKKDKKKKKKKTKHTSSSEDSSSEEEIIQKKKAKRHEFTESSSSEDDSDDSDEWVEQTSEKRQEGGTTRKTEQHQCPKKREDWMTEAFQLKTYSKEHPEKKARQTAEAYDPSKCSRELNPHWKNGGGGLPSFQKPKDEYDDYENKNASTSSNSRKYEARGNWRKKTTASTDSSQRDIAPSSNQWGSGSKRFVEKSDSAKFTSPSEHPSRTEQTLKKPQSPASTDSEHDEDPPQANTRPDQLNFLTDQQMNELGAKIIKAEIMGDAESVKELNLQLSKAREVRNSMKTDAHRPASVKTSTSTGRAEEEHIHTHIQAPTGSLHTRSQHIQAPTGSFHTRSQHIQAPTGSFHTRSVLLTTTDSKGITRPLPNRSALGSPQDAYGRNKKRRTTKTETHASGERVRYFPDDDRYDIKQMFEREKYTTAQDFDAQFAEIAGKHKNPKDDLEDIFADRVRKGLSDYDKDEKEQNRAIREHEQFTKMLDSCDRCFDSSKMEKQLIVCMGATVYLSLPHHEALQPGHCLISPIQHVACSTQLDEDSWAEVNDFRSALTKMFRTRSQDVVFFETARYLNRRPHMAIHCIPSRQFDMAPFYFKKAIQESEQMWSTNKQLISLKDTSVRRAIPKGLPYFWVHFGMDSGFAHVIEDQQRFPSNFAQEVLGGLLNLDTKLWRKPRREYNPIPKVKQFADWWKGFDCTKN